MWIQFADSEGNPFHSIVSLHTNSISSAASATIFNGAFEVRTNDSEKWGYVRLPSAYSGSTGKFFLFMPEVTYPRTYVKFKTGANGAFGISLDLLYRAITTTSWTLNTLNWDNRPQATATDWSVAYAGIGASLTSQSPATVASFIFTPSLNDARPIMQHMAMMKTTVDVTSGMIDNLGGWVFKFSLNSINNGSVVSVYASNIEKKAPNNVGARLARRTTWGFQ